ncbi:ribonuclease E/G [Velocimicrobium porci]|uniref:Ribonuclease E/G n=1 Tax=Velocimicrobium porci TaxID=2606634 RepID=A0A6L5XZF3_9FIRM|nr:ribonuclease E/G [Velocimicrobium porci]MSS63999.1 ribonuclease E/G [Velocimicrobium porci]
MSNRFVITKKGNQILSAYMEKDELIQVSLEDTAHESILSNIYLGKVKNIVKNIRAAFVEIADKRMCYLSLDSCKKPVFVNKKNTDAVTVGDTIVVQIAREDVKTKAPVLTTEFNFTGKYVVLTHGKTNLGISGKISDEKERERLKNILKPHKSSDYGWIIRTNAKDASKEQIEKEIAVLKSLYMNLLEFGVHKTCFSLIYKAPAAYLCDIRNGMASSIEEVVTDDKELYDEMREYLNCYQQEDVEKVRFYEDSSISLKRLYGLETKLEKALQRKVWLKSGGTLIIDPTEALTVIDVNTGKAIKGNKKIQDTFLKVNLEAAYEIAKQIRLRNISGIILIDFIDLDKKEAREELLEVLEGYLKKDPVKTVLVDMTPLGLVEITRKKVRKPLWEQISK